MAAGSAREVQTALRVAEAWGDLDAKTTRGVLATLDRFLGMLWAFTR